MSAERNTNARPIAILGSDSFDTEILDENGTKVIINPLSNLIAACLTDNPDLRISEYKHKDGSYRKAVSLGTSKLNHGFVIFVDTQNPEHITTLDSCLKELAWTTSLPNTFRNPKIIIAVQNGKLPEKYKKPSIDFSLTPESINNVFKFLLNEIDPKSTPIAIPSTIPASSSTTPSSSPVSSPSSYSPLSFASSPAPSAAPAPHPDSPYNSSQSPYHYGTTHFPPITTSKSPSTTTPTPLSLSSPSSSPAPAGSSDNSSPRSADKRSQLKRVLGLGGFFKRPEKTTTHSSPTPPATMPPAPPPSIYSNQAPSTTGIPSPHPAPPAGELPKATGTQSASSISSSSIMGEQSSPSRSFSSPEPVTTATQWTKTVPTAQKYSEKTQTGGGWAK